MSEIKGKIIDHFYGGIQRDDKSRMDGAALNIEEIDIYENANFVQASQIMSHVSVSSGSPSPTPSATPSGSPSDSPSGSQAATPSPSDSPSASPSTPYNDITFDAHSNSSYFASGTSTSWTHTVVNDPGTILLVSVYTGVANTSNMTVTYDGVSMTLLQTAVYDLTNAYIRTFYLVQPSVGANTVQVNWSTSSYGQAMATSYSGVNTTDPIDTSGATSVDRTSPVTVTLTPSDSNNWWYGAAILSNVNTATLGVTGALSTIRGSENDLLAVADSNGTVSATEQSGGFTDTGSNLTGVIGVVINRSLVSSSPSATPSSSPSTSVAPSSQVEINAYTGDNTDITWGLGKDTDTGVTKIFRLYDGGSDTPDNFILVKTSSDTSNLAISASPLMYHKTSESDAIYYLKEHTITNSASASPSNTASASPSNTASASPSGSPSASPTANSASATPSGSPSASPEDQGDTSHISLVRYNIATGNEETWNGTTWAVQAPDSNARLTGLNGQNDRYFMRVEFGELYISNGNKIAKVANDGEFEAAAFTLPNAWEGIDMCFVADVGLILSRHINRNQNYCKVFWWDLTSTEQFDDAMTISHGGPQWITNFNERIVAFCSQNGVGRFYAAQASPGAKLIEIPGLQLKNVATETSDQAISSQKNMAVKDNVLYFGLWKTDKTGIYAIGQLDEDKPMALSLSKRYDTSDYSAHKPVALHTQGPNFYASFVDGVTFKHSRCETNNSPDRSQNAVYESVILDEGDPTKDKDMLSVYVTTKPLPISTAVSAYLSTDYGDYVQIYEQNSTSFDTNSALLGNFRAKSRAGKTHQIKFQLTSNGTNSPKVTGIAYMTRVLDRPAHQ